MRFWTGVLLFCIIFAVWLEWQMPTLPAPAASSQSNNAPAEPELLSHKVIDEEVYDSPNKSQLIRHVVVDATPDMLTHARLTPTLERLFQDAASRTGFTHHDLPNAIYVYLYPSEEHARSRTGRLAAIEKSKNDNAPTIKFYDDFIARLQRPDEELKFGLTEAQRKAVYFEVVQAEDRASREAEQRYPGGIGGRNDLATVNARSQLSKALMQKYRKPVARKHGLTTEQLKAISMEGAVNKWPMPS